MSYKLIVENYKGFTLIELIVVFTTIAFLSIIGIVSYRTYSQSQSLQAATQELVTTIQLAKSRVNSQVKPPAVCVGQLDGYSLEISIASSKYTLNVVCSNSPYPLQITTLPNNITFAPATNVTKLFFTVITGGVEGFGDIVVSGYGLTKTITIDNVGVIKVQ